MFIQHIKIFRNAANKYLPDKISFLFIAESPPWSLYPQKAGYFYFDECTGNEMFFSTILNGIFGIKYYKGKNDKCALLSKLKDNGIWLTDAVEFPINKDENGLTVSNKTRERIIRENLSNLLDGLNRFKEQGIVNRKTKLILIKETVHNALYDSLKEKGFNILNEKYIAFPRYSFDPNVTEPIKKLLDREGFGKGELKSILKTFLNKIFQYFRQNNENHR